MDYNQEIMGMTWSQRLDEHHYLLWMWRRTNASSISQVRRLNEEYEKETGRKVPGPFSLKVFDDE